MTITQPISQESYDPHWTHVEYKLVLRRRDFLEGEALRKSYLVDLLPSISNQPCSQ
jgi:hypothetical protein